MIGPFLRQEQWPNYVHAITRDDVLKLFRKLYRSIGLLEDQMTRFELRKMVRQEFGRFQYVTDTRRIKALIRLGQRDLVLVETAIVGDKKAIFSVTDLALRARGTKLPGAARLLSSPTVRAAMFAQEGVNPKSLVYKLNNITVPPVRSFGAHKQRMNNLPKFPDAINAEARDRNETLFYFFVHTLQSNNITTGINGRKLHFNPIYLLTVQGKDIPLCRQANILRHLYSTLLRDAFRPVSHDVIQYICSQMENMQLPRKYRRVMKELARQYWTISSEGKFYRLQKFSEL